MKVLTLDCETTGATNDTKGNSFSEGNRLCYVGCLFGSDYMDFDIQYSNLPFGEKLEKIRSLVVACDLIVLFNAKFDLHWLRRYGITEYENKKVWDCQAVEFVLQNQKARFPSLNGTSETYKLGQKLDVVKTEYWDKGIDTDQVPEDILRVYLRQDISLTYAVYKAQLAKLQKEASPKKQTLVSLINQDLLVLEEMESNGIHLDVEGCKKEAQKLQERVSELYRTLDSFWPNIPMLWSSNDCVSAALYGGIVKEDYREKYQWISKSGEVKWKERWAVREHKLPAIVSPLEGTELKKNGYYKTDEGTLRKLKTDRFSKKIIDILLELSKLEKLIGTYYDGFPKLYTEMGWTDNILHGQLNQVAVVTGRLSSNAPNQQNLPDDMRRFITSRYV